MITKSNYCNLVLTLFLIRFFDLKTPDAEFSSCEKSDVHFKGYPCACDLQFTDLFYALGCIHVDTR